MTYTYDKSGNRLTQVSSVDGTTTYTVATNSNQLTRRSLVPEDTDFATLNYSYDAEGRLTQRSERTDSDAFTYSFGSQLTQIQKTRAGVVTQTLSYGYDGGGQRVKVTDSGGTRYFLYDGGMPVLDRECPTRILTAASKSSVYRITCDMTFPDGRSYTARSTLTVNVPWVFAGFVEIGFSGSPTIEQDSETQLWKVTGRGNIRRNIRSRNSVPMSSQFHDKVRKHEAVHVKNLNTGLARTYYTLDALWANHLSDLTAKNRADLEVLVQWAVEDFIDAENKRIRQQLPALERAAYDVSDGVSPRYLYQRCNRFPE